MENSLRTYTVIYSTHTHDIIARNPANAMLLSSTITGRMPLRAILKEDTGGSVKNEEVKKKKS